MTNDFISSIGQNKDAEFRRQHCDVDGQGRGPAAPGRRRLTQVSQDRR
jgi:hypothetical protein